VTLRGQEFSGARASERVVGQSWGALFILPGHGLDAGLHIAAELCLLQELIPHRVLPGQARQKEVQGRCQPHDEQKYAASLYDIVKLYCTSLFTRRQVGEIERVLASASYCLK
jgi:hypothetical protein